MESQTGKRKPPDPALMRTPEAQRKAAETRKLDPIERAERKPTSLKLAIAANCFQCVGGRHGGPPAYPALIRECEIADCALHRHRPYQPKQVR